MARAPLRTAATVIAAALLLAACSSAPKARLENDTVKNEAAQYAAAGNRYFTRGDYADARKFFELSLRDNLSIYNEPGMARSYNSLGKVALAVGDLDGAEADFENAFGLASRLGDSELLAETEGNLGELKLARGDPGAALVAFRAALAKLTDPQSLVAARLYHNIGAAYKELGTYPSALESLNHALSLHIALKAVGEQASDYYMIASVYSKEGDLKQAVDYASRALAADQKMENAPGIGSDLLALGLIAEKAGDLQTAYRRYYSSFQVYESIGMVANVKELLAKLVTVAGELGRADDAARYRKALSSLEGQTK